MYAISRGEDREFISEAINHVTYYKEGIFSTRPVVSHSTIPHSRNIMPIVLKYLTPTIYNVTMVDGNILSPFHHQNRHFYKYRVRWYSDQVAEIRFRPRTDNTQLVKGNVLVQTSTGRIIRATIHGEYDMNRFDLKIRMGYDGIKSLLPLECEMNATFKFLGNKIENKYVATYHLDSLSLQEDSIPLQEDSIKPKDRLRFIEAHRPEPLSPQEKNILQAYSEELLSATAKDSVLHKKSWTQRILWDRIGNHLVNRIKSNWGSDAQGYLHIKPILNPFYLGYSDSKGVIYKFDMRLNYRFSDRYRFSSRTKISYSFKQHRFFYHIPLSITLSKSKNRYLNMELGNSNLIQNGEINQDVQDILGIAAYDSLHKTTLSFYNVHFKGFLNYSINKHFGFQTGLLVRHRKAYNPTFFKNLGITTSYKTTAPFIELQFSPSFLKESIITANYERSIKGVMNSNMSYERWEFDGQYRHQLPAMRSIQTRIGYGFYTARGSNGYFYDYENFRENNLEGGWNDDWSGEFELLNSDWYNQSDYYFRCNLTYESPLLFAAWIPLVGHFVENERLYIGTMGVKNIKPYTEIGYGVTTRLFSMGIFASFKEHHYERFGVKFGFELFSKW